MSKVLNKLIRQYRRGRCCFSEHQLAIARLCYEQRIAGRRWRLYPLAYSEWTDRRFQAAAIQAVASGCQPPRYSEKPSMTEDGWELVYAKNERTPMEGVLCQLWIPWLYGQVAEVSEWAWLSPPGFIAAMQATEVVDLDEMGIVEESS
jgi:hypothetical protein